jgi:CheY-like chemotaxis protein
VKTRVLVAEDNKDMLELLRLWLERLNYEVIGARDGIKAVELATAETPALIIMDIAMPKLSGLEAASQIKNNPETQGIPILAVSGMAEPRNQNQDPQTVCDGYIAKPFTFQNLEAAIKRLLKDSSN